MLKKGEVIGSIHSVAAAIPMLKASDVVPSKFGLVNVIDVDKEASDSEGCGEEVEMDEGGLKFDLSHLDEREQKMMQEMLEEVKDVFSKTDSDIGDIPEFKMKST